MRVLCALAAPLAEGDEPWSATVAMLNRCANGQYGSYPPFAGDVA